MDDTDFLRLKIITEKELGRALQSDEEHHLKMLYYFGKGVKLKAQLDSGPQRIRDILPAVMQNIEARMERQQSNLERAKQE